MVVFMYLSMTPPCPGMRLPKFLLLQALLKPLHKNPATGPIVLAKMLMTVQWTRKGVTENPNKGKDENRGRREGSHWETWIITFN